MVGTNRLLSDGEGSPEERFGFAVTSLNVIDFGKDVERGADIRVIRSELILGDGEGALG